MTTDNSRYEAAAKEYAKKEYGSNFLRVFEEKDFIAGASFAEKQSWNAAIDKAIDLILRSVEHEAEHLAEELEKLKL